MNNFKFLVIGFILAILTACSHDFETYVSNADVIKAKYDAAFIQTFSKPAPSQTWGFGTAVATRATTRAIQPSYNFPGDADASKFLSDVPSGVEKLTQNNASVNNWIDETWTGDINIWGAWDGQKSTGGTLYIKGNCDFSNRSFYFMGNSELYLVAGATLTLGENNGSGNLQQNTKIYIAEGAKLVAKGELKLNNGLHIYNHGTIEAPKLSTNSNSVLYNVGTVKVAEKISVENDLSVVVNDGTITATDLNTAGTGKFQNNNEVTISGTTFINSNGNTWVNNGTYRTGNFLYNATSDDVINNCRLTVDEDFNMNLGDNAGNGNFKMDAGSSVVTKNFNGGGNWAGTYAGTYSSFNGGPFYVYMGSNSVFKVTGTATMNATKANYGIYGPESGDYAVFEAKTIVAGQPGQGYEVTYGGNLAVVTESHFANGKSGSYPYIDIKGNAKIYASGFEEGEPEIYIEPTECNPGFGSATTKPEPEPEEPAGDDKFTFLCRVFAEDLSAETGTDFDFNDVVFDVYTDNNGNAEVRLLAAGGTLPLTINGVEVHEAFGVPVSTMVNTGLSQGHTAAPILVQGITNETDVNEKIKLVVMKNGTPCELTAYKGEPAAKFAVPRQIEWQVERQEFTKMYPGFKDWVGDPSIQWW